LAIPDEGGGGSYGTYEYDSFGGKVNVEVTDMVTYYQEMSMLSGEIGTAAGSAMGEMSMMIATGLNQAGGDAGVFPEGAMAARTISSRLAEFQMFVRDLHEGVRNVGSGAVVIAEIYENADNENGATVNDIGFVFGDPRSRPPGDFRGGEVKTFDDVAQESGQNAMALTSDNSLARPLSYPYGTIYSFPDGSTKHITSRTEAGGHNTSDAIVTTTTITDKNGNVISTVTERTYSNHMGYNYTTTTTTNGDERNNRTSSTTTAEAPNGDITVSNTASTTTDGKQGPETSNTTTVERGEHRVDEDRGPVETATENMDSHGSDGYVKDHGAGY
jgi:hypothetical protein